MWACISALALSVYRSGTVSRLSSRMMGLVCVLGGTFLMSLVIFFCILIRGWSWVLVGLSVPHTEIAPIKCG